MPYEKKISRANPGLVELVLDDSGSMGDPLPGTSDPKYSWNERYSGLILKHLLALSTDPRGDGFVVKPRYFFHIVRYGGSPQLWGGSCADIQKVVEKYAADGNSLGLGGKLGGTDAAAAFQEVLGFTTQAVKEERFQNSFPPLLLHLTDGKSASDARPVADRIKQLATTDGNVLLLNAFIGTQTSLAYKGPEDFPGYLDAAEAGPDRDNLRLFDMSSPVPESMHRNLVEDQIFPQLRPGARFFFDVRTKEMLRNVFQTVGSMGSRAERMTR